MNPIDHPHGGGEGKTAAGRDPVSPWGTPTKGYKTRRNKRTRGMTSPANGIIQSELMDAIYESARTGAIARPKAR